MNKTASRIDLKQVALAILCLAGTLSFVGAQNSPCEWNAPILDNSCTASSLYPITVSGVSGTQLGVDVVLTEVRLIVEHTWDNDLDIYLRAPSGMEVELSTDNGGGADHYGDPSDPTCSNYTSFSRNACTPIALGTAPFIGDYLPEGDLAGFNDGSNPNGTWILQICDDAASDIGFVHFAELVFEQMTCLPPAQPMADLLTDTSITISWLPGSNCVNTLLEYGPMGFIPGTGATANEGTLITLPCPAAQPYTISGLDDLTTFDVYLREACANGGFSANSCALTATTDCASPPVTLSESFDAQPTCPTTCGVDCTVAGTWFNASDDDFDWIIDREGTGSSGTGPTDDVSLGGNYLYTEASGSACRDGKQAVLQSQCLSIEAEGSTCHFSFYAHLYGIHIGELQLQISTDGGTNWASLWSRSGDQGDQWVQYYVDLSVYNNKLATLRFVATGGDGIRGDIAIDDLQFYGATHASGGGNTYFSDQDDDGFGDAHSPIVVCSDIPPSGYVANSADCNDTDAAISPTALEIPCNMIDDNCDGILMEQLPAPQVSDQLVCIGQTAALSVNTSPVGEWYWLDDSDNVLFVGDVFTTPPLSQNTNFWVKDSLIDNCGSLREMIVVAVDPGPNVGTNDQPEICEGTSFDLAGISLIDADNTVANISYHHGFPTDVNNLLSSSIVQPGASTVYYIRTETVNGCPTELPVLVTVDEAPTATITAAEITICANELTTLTGSASGGSSGLYTYLWDDGSTATSYTVYPATPPGPESYVLQVTDAKGCVGTDTAVITTLPSITGVGISEITDVDFCNGDNGSITLSPVDGQPPYTYHWDGPQSGEATNADNEFTLEGLSQGAYQITVFDSAADDCQVYIPIIIVNGPGVVVDTAVQIQPVSCEGGTDGGIFIGVTGGSPTYLWSDGSTSQDLSGVPAGTYAVTITESGCETILDNLQIPQPAALTIEVAALHSVSCFGSTDGTIDANVVGGTGPYSYQWSNGAVTPDIDQLPAGDYLLTIIDNNDCAYISDAITVATPDPLTVVVEEATDVSCSGIADGTITVSVTGGTAPYLYEWDHGALTSEATDLPEGSYKVSITDANDCVTELAEIIIEAPVELEVTVSQITPPSCNQVFDGAIDVTVSGGTPPYTYLWSNGATSEAISGLPEGSYQLTITDNQGCTITTTLYELMAPDVLFFDSVIIQEEYCAGVGNGAIDVQMAGGTPPYTYLWSTGSVTEDLQNLPAGEYFVTVTDANGCTTESAVVEVVALEPLAANIDFQQDISCAGANDGSIFISLPPNGMPYEYLWNNNATTQDLQNLPPGTYQAEISAGNGCIFFTPPIVVSEPDTLTLEVVSVEPPTCNGFDDGSVDVAVLGGTPPYTFGWNNGTNNEDLTGVPSGSYLLTVLDNNMCPQATNLIELTEPEALQLADVETTDVGCVDSIGSVQVTAAGGIPPYNYEWSTGNSGPAIEDLPTGTYNISITDANGCFLVHSALMIDQLVDTIAVAANLLSGLSCFGAADAELAVEVMGGNYPFQYNWSNGVTDSLNQNLSGGEYNVTVTDNYGCVGVAATVSVEEPSAISYLVDSIVDNQCQGDETGSISMTLSGGMPPYNLAWNNGDDGATIDELATGEYVLTITDQNDCSVVTVPPIPVGEPQSSIQVQLIGHQDIACFGDMDGQLSIQAFGGAGGFSFLWNNGAITPAIDNLEAGWYQCTVTDVNNCSFITQGYTVEGPDVPLNILMPGSEVAHNTECGGMEGSIFLFVEGGTEAYSFYWSHGELTQNIDGLASGEYICTVIDANGCQVVSDVFQIEEPENNLDVLMTSTPDTNTIGNGTATAEVTGGSWPYTFEWDQNTGSQTDSIVSGLPAGYYMLTITDANNCTRVEEVWVDSTVVIIDGVEEVASFGRLDCYPNPVRSQLVVELMLHQSANASLRLFSILGQPVRQVDLPNVLYQKTTLDVAVLPTGVYLLELSLNGHPVGRERVVVE